MSDDTATAEDTKPPFLPGELRTLRLVASEPTPDKLFACSAKVREDVAAALRSLFDKGIDLPEEVESLYRKHLAYNHGLGEKFYEAGPSADFTEILYIYRTETLEEARELIHADPLFTDGGIGGEWLFEWRIHAPLYKAGPLVPPLPEQELELEVAITTPETLVAAFGSFNFDTEPLRAWRLDRAARPLFDVLHAYNMHGQGGIAAMGMAWGCGPTGDWKHALHIFATPTVEMAKFYNEGDALCRWGVAKDFRYFEWCIHYPVRKATPRHKEVLERFIKNSDAS
ncbi:hypothetical protein [Streptomyces sp. NPDC058086]|uniref:hypothetical protein n=1 Tax=Streptomyces sp. NPDC058086 TaxID=3346334 RepID=UPI0036EAF336